jgi:hypothetical protein
MRMNSVSSPNVAGAWGTSSSSASVRSIQSLKACPSGRDCGAGGAADGGVRGLPGEAPIA